MATSYGDRALTPDYEELYEEFKDHVEIYSCSCHISPPCSCCTHEGNPIGLVGTGKAWESKIVNAVRQVREQGFVEEFEEIICEY